MERVVLDASVAVKWVVPERGDEEALKLRERHHNGTVELVAPTLITYEVANALRYHPDFHLTPSELLRAIAALEKLRLAHHPSRAVWAKAIELSVTHGITIYDAVYVALAVLYDAQLVTSDRKLYEKLGGELKKRTVLI
jgi:predicted nucleic acid-binding protein